MVEADSVSAVETHEEVEAEVHSYSVVEMEEEEF